MKRNHNRSIYYRQFFTHCMIWGCANPAQEVHHIVPFRQRGKDTFVNFICLCHEHHVRCNRHHDWQEQQEELLIHKFRVELEVFGFTSDIPEDTFRQKIALWRIDNGLSCLTSNSPQERATIKNKHENSHKYGVLIEPTESAQTTEVEKTWRCHWCGEIIDSVDFRKYCPYPKNCYRDYLEWQSFVRWFYDILITKIIYYNPRRFKRLNSYLSDHNGRFEILGGLYSIIIHDKIVEFIVPDGEYCLSIPERYVGRVKFVEEKP